MYRLLKQEKYGAGLDVVHQELIDRSGDFKNVLLNLL